jgi:hypothetical protein
MRIRLSKKLQAGGTLAEVVTSVAIVAITAGGVLGSLSYGFFVMELARQNQRATQILLEKAETIRLYNWSQVTNAGFIPTAFTNTYDPQAAVGAQGVTYRGTLAITNTPFLDAASYRANMRQLTITVNWQTKAIAHTRTLTTYVAMDGIQNYVY